MKTKPFNPRDYLKTPEDARFYLEDAGEEGLPEGVRDALKVCEGLLPEWQTKLHDDLPDAIAEFKARLPGWWYSVCECQVSCDASCAPTSESPDIKRIKRQGDCWDAGFDADLRQPSTLADALRAVMHQALAAIAEDDAQWVDPDDAPEWSEDVFDRAEMRDGETVIRPAKGTLTKGEGVG